MGWVEIASCSGINTEDLFMKDIYLIMQNSQPKAKNSNADYDPRNSDIQRMKKIPLMYQSQRKKNWEKRKQRIHRASTTPDKKHIG